MDRDPDVIVIGSGPNGLVAACVLAKKGFRVLVLEANPRRPGGALGSEEATSRGFLHDVGASFFPFGKSSPAFRYLELGNRTPGDNAFYPDDDLMWGEDEAGEFAAHKDGRRY